MNKLIPILLIALGAGGALGAMTITGVLPIIPSSQSRLTLDTYEFRSNCTLWFTYRATEDTGIWAWNVRYSNGTAISVSSNGGKQTIAAGETKGMELNTCGYGEFAPGQEYVISGELWDYGFTKDLPDIEFRVTWA